jgi:uncharacterized LabA/DUF88 family protein
VDIPRLARILARQSGGHLLKGMRYYAAPSPNQGSDSARKQQTFFEVLRASTNVTLILGRHERRGNVHVEKETDVKLAVDMVSGAFKGEYDVAMLITGDTDYVPAVKAVRETGRRVIWCHFPNQKHSLELKHNCDSTLELNDKILRTCRR